MTGCRKTFFVEALQEASVFIQKKPELTWHELEQKFPLELAPSVAIASVNPKIWSLTYPFFPKDPGEKSKAKTYDPLESYLEKNQALPRAVAREEYSVS